MIEDLSKKNMKELRDIARSLNLGGVKHENAQALRARITFALQPGLLDEINKNGTEQGRAVKQDKPAIQWLTVAQVKEALRPFSRNLQIAFYDENGNPTEDKATTWHVKNGPAEDSGTMSISLAWLKIKAGEIANARFPAKYGNDAGKMAGALSI